MMLRTKLYFFFIAVITIVFAGCDAKRESGESGGNGNIVLTYWSAANPQEIELAEERVAMWNAEHPDVQVKLQPIPASKSSEEVLLAAIAAKTTPDICSNIAPGMVEEYVDARSLVNYDRFEDFEEFARSRFPESFFKDFKASDGHFYQLPKEINPIMIYYNKKLFAEVGIDNAPRTYSEFIEAAKKVTADTDGDGRIDRWMAAADIDPIWWRRIFDYYTYYLAASGGGKLLDGDNVVFDNEASIEVFSFFKKMFSEGYFPRATFATDPFLAGKTATVSSGPWHMRYIDENKPEGFEYGVITIPVPDGYEGPWYTYGGMKSTTIFTTTKHPKEAWEFVKFMYSKENDVRLMEITNQMPYRKDITTDPMFEGYFKANPVLAEFAKQLPYSRELDMNIVIKEVLDGISKEFEMCAIYGVKDANEAVNDAAKRARVIIEWNKSR